MKARCIFLWLSAVLPTWTVTLDPHAGRKPKKTLDDLIKTDPGLRECAIDTTRLGCRKSRLKLEKASQKKLMETRKMINEANRNTSDVFVKVKANEGIFKKLEDDIFGEKSGEGMLADAKVLSDALQESLATLRGSSNAIRKEGRVVFGDSEKVFQNVDDSVNFRIQSLNAEAHRVLGHQSNTQQEVLKHKGEEFDAKVQSISDQAESNASILSDEQKNMQVATDKQKSQDEQEMIVVEKGLEDIGNAIDKLSGEIEKALVDIKNSSLSELGSVRSNFKKKTEDMLRDKREVFDKDIEATAVRSSQRVMSEEADQQAQVARDDRGLSQSVSRLDQASENQNQKMKQEAEQVSMELLGQDSDLSSTQESHVKLLANVVADSSTALSRLNSTLVTDGVGLSKKIAEAEGVSDISSTALKASMGKTMSDQAQGVSDELSLFDNEYRRLKRREESRSKELGDGYSKVISDVTEDSLSTSDNMGQFINLAIHQTDILNRLSSARLANRVQSLKLSQKDQSTLFQQAVGDSEETMSDLKTQDSRKMDNVKRAIEDAIHEGAIASSKAGFEVATSANKGFDNVNMQRGNLRHVMMDDLGSVALEIEDLVNALSIEKKGKQSVVESFHDAQARERSELATLVGRSGVSNRLFESSAEQVLTGEEQDLARSFQDLEIDNHRLLEQYGSAFLSTLMHSHGSSEDFLSLLLRVIQEENDEGITAGMQLSNMLSTLQGLNLASSRELKSLESVLISRASLLNQRQAGIFGHLGRNSISDIDSFIKRIMKNIRDESSAYLSSIIKAFARVSTPLAKLTEKPLLLLQDTNMAATASADVQGIERLLRNASHQVENQRMSHFAKFRNLSSDATNWIHGSDSKLELIKENLTNQFSGLSSSLMGMVESTHSRLTSDVIDAGNRVHELLDEASKVIGREREETRSSEFMKYVEAVRKSLMEESLSVMSSLDSSSDNTSEIRRKLANLLLYSSDVLSEFSHAVSKSQKAFKSTLWSLTQEESQVAHRLRNNLSNRFKSVDSNIGLRSTTLGHLLESVAESYKKAFAYASSIVRDINNESKALDVKVHGNGTRSSSDRKSLRDFIRRVDDMVGRMMNSISKHEVERRAMMKWSLKKGREDDLSKIEKASSIVQEINKLAANAGALSYPFSSVSKRISEIVQRNREHLTEIEARAMQEVKRIVTLKETLAQNVEALYGVYTNDIENLKKQLSTASPSVETIVDNLDDKVKSSTATLVSDRRERADTILTKVSEAQLLMTNELTAVKHLLASGDGDTRGTSFAETSRKNVRHELQKDIKENLRMLRMELNDLNSSS